MKILFTGGSSFTGCWFMRELVRKGHNVIATFTKEDINQYSGIRAKRIAAVIDHVTPVWACRFGDERFIKTMDELDHIDVLCHHAADATNYKSDTFDIGAAINSNTNNIIQVIQKIKEKACENIICTGSVFEANEGEGDDTSNAFSPYGLSKQFSFEIIRHFSGKAGIKLGKFVIPNPFGPYEEERFTNYLVRSWVKNEKAVVRTPDYIRDNIHIDLLAKVYAGYVENFIASKGVKTKCSPSGYAGTQKEFTEHFAKEISDRLKIKCQCDFLRQTEFAEPLKRINNEDAIEMVPDWNEKNAWDGIADYYKVIFKL